MKLKIKKLHPNAIIPKYVYDDDAGMNIYAVTKEEKPKYIEYGTGLAFELMKDHVMLVYPRSSLSDNDLILANHVGVLDPGYRGELKLRFKRIGNDVYEVGDKIGQIIILPFPRIEFVEVEKLSRTKRGSNSFGSTGK